MASISKDSKGHRRILFVNAEGKRKAIRLGKVSQESALGVKFHVEKLLEASFTQQALSNRTAAWVGDLESSLYDKLAAAGLLPKRAEQEQTTLAGYLESYISKRTDVKASTAIVYGHTQRCLIEFFGAKRALTNISEGEADEWRLYLIEQGLADNTVRRRCGIAKQFFRAAVRKKLLPANPFGDLVAAVKAHNGGNTEE
jgi:Phage integrase SAM-like domain